jgi:hypothetical protein
MNPLQPYIDKLERREPFTLLTYGDGEFLVAMGRRTGQRFTHYQEVVTPQLEQELRDSLDVDDPSIIRGTDLNLINWQDYGGGDAANIAEIGKGIDKLLEGRNIKWADGVVWDTAARDGELGPFLRAMKSRNVTSIVSLFGHPALFPFWKTMGWAAFTPVEPKNASSTLDNLEEIAVESARADVYVLCMGLGAIPFIMRLRKRFPQATFLDLGSTFDVFVGLGAERGWRAGLYADKVKWQALVAKHLEGLL